MSKVDLKSFFDDKVIEAKKQFERTIDCKHTEFDTLYPYMGEQPQFFWYKRYVSWQELLTIIKLAKELDMEWQGIFTKKQIEYIDKKVLDAKVLDDWYDHANKEEEKSSLNEH